VKIPRHIRSRGETKNEWTYGFRAVKNVYRFLNIRYNPRFQDELHRRELDRHTEEERAKSQYLQCELIRIW